MIWWWRPARAETHHTARGNHHRYPPAGAEVRQRSVAIRGTVVGDALLDTMVLRVKTGLPGDATAPTSENAVALSGAGPNRTFSLDYGLIEGPYTVTALATNTANLQGSATIDFTNRPRQVSCPDPKSQEIFDITASTRDPIQLGIFTEKLGQDGMTVRLGPGVKVDFPMRLPPELLSYSRRSMRDLNELQRFGSWSGGSYRSPYSAVARARAQIRQASRGGRIRNLSADSLLFSDGPDNDGARISGFRLTVSVRLGQQSELQVAIRIVRCVDVDISNMEIAGWGGDGISVMDDPGPDQAESNTPGGRISDPDQVRIHDNFFHHNQHPSEGGSAEGYGVNVGQRHGRESPERVRLQPPRNRHARRHRRLRCRAIIWCSRAAAITADSGIHTPIVSTSMEPGCMWSEDVVRRRGDQVLVCRECVPVPEGLRDQDPGTPRQSAYIAENVFPHPGLEDDGVTTPSTSTRRRTLRSVRATSSISTLSDNTASATSTVTASMTFSSPPARPGGFRARRISLVVSQRRRRNGSTRSGWATSTTTVAATCSRSRTGSG